MSAAPSPIYAYPYTAWSGRVDNLQVFIGEIEAHSTLAARPRVRALHRALFAQAPRRIVFGKPLFLRTTEEGGYRYKFLRNGQPQSPIPLVGKF